MEPIEKFIQDEIEQMQESWSLTNHREAAVVEDVMKRAVRRRRWTREARRCVS